MFREPEGQIILIMGYGATIFQQVVWTVVLHKKLC